MFPDRSLNWIISSKLNTNLIMKRTSKKVGKIPGRVLQLQANRLGKEWSGKWLQFMCLTNWPNLLKNRLMKVQFWKGNTREYLKFKNHSKSKKPFITNHPYQPSLTMMRGNSLHIWPDKVKQQTRTILKFMDLWILTTLRFWFWTY